MDIDDLMSDEVVLKKLQALQRKVQRDGKTFSDIIDDAGNQYVDLVMEGGGMLGIALVGYTWALEQMGIRFLGIGGTSAGSINALLIAALDVPANAKSPKLLELLASKNFYDFVDGDDDARDFIESWIEGSGKLKLSFKGAQVLDNLNERLGLNPGKAFENWIRDVLSEEGIHKRSELDARLQTLPAGLRTRSGTRLNTAKKAGSKLAIVAADVSTETRVIFPQMADMYFRKPDDVNPALFVRASMSIPFFFEPLRLGNLPRDAAAEKRWIDVGYDPKLEDGGLPTSAVFIDGGIMSNFPIDLFHVPTGVPDAPTLGVKLEYDHRRQNIDGPFSLLGAIFNSARHCLDYEFIHRNPDYERLLQWIPCQGYNWLDFNMSDDHKRGLFVEGALKAIEFLEKFDWAGYKKLREKISLK